MRWLLGLSLFVMHARVIGLPVLDAVAPYNSVSSGSCVATAVEERERQIFKEWVVKLIPRVSETRFRRFRKEVLKHYPRHLHITEFVSFGGVQSSLIMQWAFHTLPCNWYNDGDGLKHIRPCRVPKVISYRELHLSRVVYLFDDPRIALLSLYKRSYQKPQLKKTRSCARPAVLTPQLKQAASNISEYFRNEGGDIFGFEDHFEHWKRGAAELNVPVLFLRSSSVHRYLSELSCFLHLPIEDAAPVALMVPPRETKLSDCTLQQGAVLNKTFGDLLRKMKEVTDCRIYLPNGQDRACVSDSHIAQEATKPPDTQQPKGVEQHLRNIHYQVQQLQQQIDKILVATDKT